MDPRIIGFTGTRLGMTPEQRQTVKELISVIHFAAKGAGTSQTVGLHGDCIGADADFHKICVEQEIPVECRPCTFDSLRAKTGAKERAAPTTPMVRNRAIVDDAFVMFACPPNDIPIRKGSGTWATIRYTKKRNKPLVTIFPNGTYAVSP